MMTRGSSSEHDAERSFAALGMFGGRVCPIGHLERSERPLFVTVWVNVTAGRRRNQPAPIRSDQNHRQHDVGGPGALGPPGTAAEQFAEFGPVPVAAAHDED